MFSATGQYWKRERKSAKENAEKKASSIANPIANPTANPTLLTLKTFLQKKSSVELVTTEEKPHIYLTELRDLGKKILLSSGSRVNESKILFHNLDLLQNKDYPIYYKEEWYMFFTLLTNIKLKFMHDQESDKELLTLLTIIEKLCVYVLQNEVFAIKRMIFRYNEYLKKKKYDIPEIIIIPETPVGYSKSNCENHIESIITPRISNKKLLLCFPGTKIPKDITKLIELLNELSNSDRFEIYQNLPEWLKNNSTSELAKVYEKEQIHYYKSICICSNCKYMISDTEKEIGDFLESLSQDKMNASFRNKDYGGNLFKNKPIGYPFIVAKKFLYFECPSCSKNIAISSIIPKLLDVSKDNKPDENYKIAEEAKLYLYKIIIKIAESTLIKQFPDFTCCVCLTDKLVYKNMHSNEDCKHQPCICLECNSTKKIEGRPARGKFYLNSNYQCLACTAFEPTGYYLIDDFNKQGGVQPGYVGRFCYNCNKPFQEKPETCGVEQGNSDISQNCIDCTIELAEYNKKIRLTVKCPNIACNKPISRYDGCDVIQCPECNMQFCYGCEYIFTNPPNFDWAWTCSCIIYNTSPRQYEDKTQSVCETRYIEYQSRRGIIMPVPESVLPVPEPELPIPESALPRRVVSIFDSDSDSDNVIDIDIININYININTNTNVGISNPQFQERRYPSSNTFRRRIRR